ncbi:MAG TPA: hypothetical protein VFM46_09395 [Pseudomonadales bacterium]|nr:hypothetical protein [Pseudomonadales bacterium]
MINLDQDDPFSPDADPDLHLQPVTVRAANAAPQECLCGFNRALSRRQVLLGASALAATPVLAAAAPFSVPCVQDKQKVNPCRHKFCRHYAGDGDYYQR